MPASDSHPAILFVLTSAAVVGPRHRASGYEFSEVAHPYAELSERGWRVDFASPQGGRPPEDGYDPTDPVAQAFRLGEGFARLGSTTRLEVVRPEDYAAVFFPGGLGPMVDLATSTPAKQVIARCAALDRIIAAVCHGPVALLDVPIGNGRTLVHGRRLTAFSTAEEVGHSYDDVPFLLDAALQREGALYSCAPPCAEHVVVDGRLITGQNPASARGVAQAIAAVHAGAG